MDIKYKYIEHQTTFFVLLLWNRTWSELSVKIQKIIQKIPFLKLFFPVVLSIFRRTSLKQAWGVLIAVRSSLGVDGCGQQLRTAQGWARWDASGVPCIAQNKSALRLRSRGKSWNEEARSHLPEKHLGLRSEGQHKPAGPGNPLCFLTPFSVMQKVSGNDLLWFCAQEVDIWFLLSLLLIAVIKWLWNYLTVTECRFGACVYTEVEVNQLRDVWNRHSWQHAAKQMAGWICILFNTSKKVLSCDL